MLLIFPENMRQALVYSVVSVVEREVAEHQRGVQRVRDEHVYRRAADQHFGDAGYVAGHYYQHEGEALAFSRAADP